MTTLAALPEWAVYLIGGIGLCLQLVFCALVASRAGRSPYWALLSIVPYFYLPVIAVWGLAFCRWPSAIAHQSPAISQPSPGQ